MHKNINSFSYLCIHIMDEKQIIITKEALESAYKKYFSKEKFLEVDPCGIVYELIQHTSNQLDIELGALFVAMITWGNRKAIKTAARKMLGEEMKWQPSKFILEKKYAECYKDAKNGCVYRTLNREKFMEVCQRIHLALMEGSTRTGMPIDSMTLEIMFEHNTIEEIIAILCDWLAPARLGKAGVSACKRICMYLRWMVRTGEPDLGLWRNKEESQLYAVMDVHVCQLTSSIISRKQADWKACTELTNIFRSWDKSDPLKYDIALMTVADNGF